MVYGISSGRTGVQRPVIAAAIQRSVSSSSTGAGAGHYSNRILRRYLKIILNVLFVTVLYTAFVYTHGACRVLVFVLCVSLFFLSN